MGITLACLRERDYSPGKDCIGAIAPLLLKGDAGHFERDAHERLVSGSNSWPSRNGVNGMGAPFPHRRERDPLSHRRLSRAVAGDKETLLLNSVRLCAICDLRHAFIARYIDALQVTIGDVAR